MAEAVHPPIPRALGARTFPAPSPAVAYAIRLGLGVSAAIWLGKAPGLVNSHSTWILITVLVLTQQTTGASLLKAMLRGMGTLAAACSAIVLFGLFSQTPPLLMMGLYFVQVVGAYGFSGARFQYAWYVFAFTTAVVLGDAMAGQGAVETVAFERASMVGIGILLVFVIDSLVWPRRAEPLLRQALAGRARLQSGALGRAVSSSGDSGDDDVAASPPESASLASQLDLVNVARSELGVSRNALDALSNAAMLLEALGSRARVLAAPVEVPEGIAAEAGAFATAQRRLARHVEAALEEIADALVAARPPLPFSDDLEDALMRFEGERDRLVGGPNLEASPYPRRMAWRGALEARAADIRDLVALLVALESTLSSPIESTSVGRFRPLLQFRPDPFRTKVALRTGVAVVAAFLVPMALGWPINILVAPIAFMTAVLTRGAAAQTVAAIVAALALAWGVADFLTVYISPHQGRAPLMLIPPFAIAFVFAYAAAKRPLLALLPSMGGLVVFLSVYGGMSAQTDVYGTYDTVCYYGVALGVGVLAGRLLWPATAAGLFRKRVAALMEFCLDALPGEGESGDTSRSQRAARLAQGCAAQSEQLGPLHRQAVHEPVERSLDSPRRTRILALVTDLADAVMSYQQGALEPLLERAGERYDSLRVAIQRVDEKLSESMQAAVSMLRGEVTGRFTGLAEAHQVVAECLDELKVDPGPLSRLNEDEKRRILILLESRRRLVSRQREVEDWLEEWRMAEAASS